MTLQDKIEELIAKLSPSIARSFREAVQDIVDSTILKQVITAIESGDINAAFRALGYSPPVFNSFLSTLTSVFETGGFAVMASLPKFVQDRDGMRKPLRFNIRDREAEEWLRNRSSQFVTGIENDTRDAVRRTVEAGFAEGRNPRNVALDVIGRIDPATGKRSGGVIGLGTRETTWSQNARSKLLALDETYFDMKLRDKRFDGVVRRAIDEGKPLPASTVDKLVDRYRDNALRHRGETIARTEALAALNRSEYVALKQAIETSDLPESAITRIWDSTRDNRVRPSHSALHGMSVSGLDEPFISPVTGSRFLYPGDTSLGASGAEVIACRCKLRVEIDFTAALG